MKIKKKVFKEKVGPYPQGPYSQVVSAGDIVFISGQISRNSKTSKFINGDIEMQTQKILENIDGILKSLGSNLKNVIKMTIFFRNMDEINGANNMFVKYFENNYPSRTCVEVSRLPKDAKIEIDTIAIIES